MLGSMQYWHMLGFYSYVFVFVSSYCLGSCLNYATATIVDQTPPEQLKAALFASVTYGSILSCTVPVGFLIWPQPVPMMGQCTALFGSFICTHFLKESQDKTKVEERQSRATILAPKGDFK